jgi:hypothetical protein
MFHFFIDQDEMSFNFPEITLKLPGQLQCFSSASALPISFRLQTNWTNTQSAPDSHMAMQAAEEMITKPFLFYFSYLAQ